MEAVTILLYLNIFVYVLFILGLIYGFTKIKSFKNKDLTPKTTFSIVVPFRNEEGNLPHLLASFSKLNYPTTLFELIFIDDVSEDYSVKAITKWRMENGLFHTTVLDNVRISNSPKKDAISRAIPIITNEWIITTDADCKVDENWLLTLDHFIQSNDVSMLVGAVTYDANRSFLHSFQQMDLMSLQGATIGSFGLNKGFMCNGANFAYTKKLFQDLNGFKGNESIASGDDVFLLQKAVSKFPEKIHYLKSESTIVHTKPLNDWKSLFYQRVRWASKTTSYESDYGEILAMGVFFGNLSLVVAFIFCLTELLYWHLLLILFLIKFTVDMVLLIQTGRFLNKGKFLFPIFSSLLYPFFSTAVALYTLFGSYEWKGRKFRI
ncbi:glycosyltransferase family 2 protein [Flavobacterium sp.]|uniref:glycosyltransferase family 2 protein n=1 Tax=Flavobacterium sp. TaxID=239 RepID=UPI002B4B1235|nr:glycosyltransferase [Flavobacterium sp.]HLF50689.1 glycosyltransferase [Flavobacterium sp.]